MKENKTSKLLQDYRKQAYTKTRTDNIVRWNHPAFHYWQQSDSLIINFDGRRLDNVLPQMYISGRYFYTLLVMYSLYYLYNVLTIR
jgi:hypothetical protein